MTDKIAEMIEQLCDSWCRASFKPDGSQVLDETTESFRLENNGIIINDLSHEAVCAALIGLSKTLLGPRYNCSIVHEHFILWAWCGELVINSEPSIFQKTPYDPIEQLYRATLHAALAHCNTPSKSMEEYLTARAIAEKQSPHANCLISKSTLILAYLSFPLLESTLKRACHSYIRLDGKVISDFFAPNKKNPSQPRKYQSGQRCSNLGDLLFLYKTKVAEHKYVVLLDQLRAHLRHLDATQDPFDLIFSWRNQSLHGETTYQTIGGLLLNLSLLISISEIEKDFENRKKVRNERCHWLATQPQRHPYLFFPPC